MAHQYKVSKWKSGSDHWYCNDVTKLSEISAKWWIPARLLNISLTDYILLLKNQYNATIVSYNKDTDVLIFYWEKEIDCNKYVRYINSVSRKVNFII